MAIWVSHKGILICPPKEEIKLLSTTSLDSCHVFRPLRGSYLSVSVRALYRLESFKSLLRYLQHLTEMGSVPEELRELCPNTPHELLTCPFCSTLATKWRLDGIFDWARVLYCACKKDWVVCAYCPKASIRMIKQATIYAHNRHCHNEATKKRVKTQERKEDGESVALSTMKGASASGEERWIEVRSSPQKVNQQDSLVNLSPGSTGESAAFVKDTQRRLFDGDSSRSNVSSLRDFGNIHSSSYFNADINGTGVADVVALCQFGISDIGKQIHPSDVQYVTDMANFVHGLSHTQRKDLSGILLATVSKVERDGDPSNKRKWKTLIPTNPSDMRRQYWEGKQSFLCNIPYPTIHSVDNHAYVSLRECIRNRLAFGFPLENLQTSEDRHDVPIRTVMEADASQAVIQRCKNAYDEPVLVLLLREWQDGYDPRSFSKKNRGSCWIKTVTIAEPHEHSNGPEVRALLRT